MSKYISCVGKNIQWDKGIQTNGWWESRSIEVVNRLSADQYYRNVKYEEKTLKTDVISALFRPDRESLNGIKQWIDISRCTLRSVSPADVWWIEGKGDKEK